MYHIAVPGLHKFDISRTSHSMPVQCPHECIERERMENPHILAEVKSNRDRGEWPLAYYNHPVVKATAATGSIVIPLVLYMDGISMTRNDGILGLFLYSVVTRRRFLLTVLRKSFLCKCGCKGWCSMYPIFAFITWSLTALSCGRWPDSKHDQNPWSESDKHHFENAGKPLSCFGCLLYIKADWAEFAHSLSYASWQSTMFPCMLCRTTNANMYCVRGFSALTDQWEPLLDVDFERAASACEINVLLDRARFSIIKPLLRYKKKECLPEGFSSQTSVHWVCAREIG